MGNLLKYTCAKTYPNRFKFDKVIREIIWGIFAPHGIHIVYTVYADYSEVMSAVSGRVNWQNVLSCAVVEVVLIIVVVVVVHLHDNSEYNKIAENIRHVKQNRILKRSY